MLTFKKLILISVFFFANSAFAKSLYDENTFTALHADKKAVFIGDALTVLVYQSVQANSSAGEGSQGEFNFNGGANVDERNWQAGVNLGSAKSGDAATNREGFVRAQLTAVVIGKDKTGLLTIEGTQKITVNEESQMITVFGVVRPEDITNQNTVASFRIQNAEISINGTGEVTRGKNGNVFTRLLQWMGF